MERNAEYWRGALEERVLKIGRKLTEYPGFRYRSDSSISTHGDDLRKVGRLNCKWRLLNERSLLKI